MEQASALIALFFTFRRICSRKQKLSVKGRHYCWAWIIKFSQWAAQQKTQNLFRFGENRIERCFTVRLCHSWLLNNSGSTMRNNLVDHIMWPMLSPSFLLCILILVIILIRFSLCFTYNILLLLHFITSLRPITVVTSLASQAITLHITGGAKNV